MAKKRKTKNPASESSAPSFEESLERLMTVVQELESGNLPLEESLKKYELGIQSLRQCHAALASAERRIEILSGLDESGDLHLQSFDDRQTVEAAGWQADSETEDPDEDPLDEADEAGNLF